MPVIKREEKSRIVGLVILFVFVIGIGALFFPTIQNTYNKLSIQRTKTITISSKTLTKDEIYKS
ncbi:hypothetical protein [Bacillus sp. AFS017336]|uniref:hypothetical protein n=1 Tax=Bacillus sp. AFS017336 TaxID=2033489 RepID=UPI000BEF7C1C|nr:hypothetical protein [Bacillus sp. AFS017336]PEL14441.1 hypothetical protein CN601_00010 [Bacillus sp. AFS017336]